MSTLNIPGGDAPGQSKIIVDSDWKSQAQAEKAKLEQASAAKKAQKTPGTIGMGSDAPEGEALDENRPIGFEDLIGMLGMQAMTYMGMVPDPQSGRSIVSVEYAKLHIDLLGILEEKTKNNLSEREKQQLTKMLAELRMSFVELSKAVAKAIQEGKIKPMNAGMGGGAGTLGGQSSGVVPNLRMTP